MASAPRKSPSAWGVAKCGAWLAALWLLAAGAAPLAAQADLIFKKKGRPLKARFWKQDARHLTCNIYRTGIRSVTHGTLKLPRKRIKKVVPDPEPHRAFWRRAGELAKGSASAWVTLALLAKKHKLKGLAEQAFEQALLRDPKNVLARKGLGSKRLQELLHGDPRFNQALNEKLQAYLKLEDPEKRAQAQQEILSLGCRWPPLYLERAWRSGRQPRGRREGILLTLRSKQWKGHYTILVPESYNPFFPTPLVVGLHGGGPGGKDGKAVVGSGREAMNFYQAGAERLGWIVVCPTAIQAPWQNPINTGYLAALLDEMRALFNVDENRIYLTGHSMGGYGTWFFGSHKQFIHQWAAIAPMAGEGRGGLQALKRTLTGVYCYHGANDPVVPVQSDRAAAKRMKDLDMDFVYAEIPDSGHDCPREVLDEMWSFFALRRLAATRSRGPKGRFKVTERPWSSFLRPLKKEELRAFGPLAGKGGQQTSLKALLVDLRAGGGRAERAVAALASHQTVPAVAAVGKLLQNTRNPRDTRLFAAKALGAMGQKSGLRFLKGALGTSDVALQVALMEAVDCLAAEHKQTLYQRGLKLLVRGFESKKIGRAMSYVDYETYLRGVGHVVRLLGKTGNPKAMSLLNLVARQFLLAPLEVPRLARAGEFPEHLRTRLAHQLVAAMKATLSKQARPVLALLVKKKSWGVASEAQRLLDRLAQ